VSSIGSSARWHKIKKTWLYRVSAASVTGTGNGRDRKGDENDDILRNIVDDRTQYSLCMI